MEEYYRDSGFLALLGVGQRQPVGKQGSLDIIGVMHVHESCERNPLE